MTTVTTEVPTEPVPITLESVARYSTSGSTPIFTPEQMERVCPDSRREDEAVSSALRDGRRADLERLATTLPEGFSCRECRQKVWPFLLNVAPSSGEVTLKRALEKGLRSKWADAVLMDAKRSFYTVQDEVDASLARVHLAAVLLKFIGYSALNRCSLGYFQGLHDIAGVVMVVTNNEDVAAKALFRLATTKLRALFADDIGPVLERPLAVVEKADPELMGFLKKGAASPLFARRWVMTWFSHDIDDPQTAQRMFDLLVATDFTQVIYLSAALMCCTRDTLMSSVPCDMASIHKFFCDAAGRITQSGTGSSGPPIDAFELIRKSVELRKDFPPSCLVDRQKRSNNNRKNQNNTNKRSSTKLVWWVVAAGVVIVALSVAHRSLNKNGQTD